MSAAVYLEAAGPDDVPALVDLERLCFSHPWTARNFEQALRDVDRGRVVVLRGAQGPEGEARSILAYSVYERVADELHVHNVAVHPKHRGQGLGRTLVRLVLELGARGGARAALLEVRRSNRAARQLYESLGFRAVATRRNYYSQPTEDALLMEAALS